MPENLPPWDGHWTPEELKADNEFKNRMALKEGRAIAQARYEKNEFLKKYITQKELARATALSEDFATLAPTQGVVSRYAKYLGPLAEGAAIATAPFGAVDRRNQLAYEWAMNNKGYPNQLELLGLNARAGIENTINPITFGAYDDYVHPNWREPMKPVQRGYHLDNGQQIPNWIPNLQSTLR